MSPELMPGGVLALDLSSVTGWAYGPIGVPSPACGVWVLAREGGEGARYASFENALAEAIDRLRPRKLLLEAPLPLMAQTHAKTAQQQYTLRGFAKAEGWRASIPVTEVDAVTVRMALLGRGRFAKDQVKKHVVAYCRSRGWKVPDHNAADACMLWAWIDQQLRSTPGMRDPLFDFGDAA